MDENNKNFSASSNGYDRSEVDAYFQTLKEEIDELKAQNDKMRRDCVSFAKRLKRIQDSGVLDEDIPELKRQNAQYRDEIVSLQKKVSKLSLENQGLHMSSAEPAKAETSSAPVPAAEKAPVEEPEQPAATNHFFKAPKEKSSAKKEKEEKPAKAETAKAAAVSVPILEQKAKERGAVFFDDEEINGTNAKLSPKTADKPKKKKKTPKQKKTKSHRGIRALLVILLILGILIAAASVAAGIIGKSAPDKTFFGLRAYTVRDNYADPMIKDTDIVFVEQTPIRDLRTNNVILANAPDGQRTFATVDAPVVDGNEVHLICSNNVQQSYPVTSAQYLGEARYRIEKIGPLVKWACNNAITYYLIVFVVLAILCLLLAVIPNGKKKKKKADKAAAAPAK